MFKDIKFRRWLMSILIILFVIGYTTAATFCVIPEGNKDLANIALGVVLGYGSTLINFNWGTSEDTEKETKDEKE